MTHAPAKIPPAEPGYFSRFIGPILIAITAAVMLYWSWGTWPDPLVDFGSQLYVPWQISSGRVLYRDIAYYNGPLSSYFNAGVFSLFGVGLRTLVWTNLIIAIAAMTLAYRLTVHTSGRLAATMSALTFALVFAFGQTVRLGNYNWITPYTHEVIHGVTLSLIALACARRFQLVGRRRWLMAIGTLLGMIFLTKAEPVAAGFSAVGTMLVSGWWMKKKALKTILQQIGVLVAFAIIVPLIATLLLAQAMPIKQAFRGVLGSWPWVMDHRITSLHFYREVAGLNDVAGNLRAMSNWSAVYAILLALGFAGAFVARSRRIGLAAAAIAIAVVGSFIADRFNSIAWLGMLTPLPICIAFCLLFAGAAVVRRSNDQAPLRLALVVFAAALMAKMGLATHAYHYGFVLAWPATVVLVCVATRHLPDWIHRRGGQGIVLQWVALAAWIGGVSAMLVYDSLNFSTKHSTIATGTTDEFRGGGRLLEVQQACDWINQIVPINGTVSVLPQGLMINYLTRRSTPTLNINFMPPEVISAGEDNILAALNRHPPDAIVLGSGMIQEGHFVLDGHDPYGTSTIDWVMKNYQPVQTVQLSPPWQTVYHFVIMEKRKP